MATTSCLSDYDFLMDKTSLTSHNSQFWTKKKNRDCNEILLMGNVRIFQKGYSLKTAVLAASWSFLVGDLWKKKSKHTWYSFLPYWLIWCKSSKCCKLFTHDSLWGASPGVVGVWLVKLWARLQPRWRHGICRRHGNVWGQEPWLYGTTKWQI